MEFQGFQHIISPWLAVPVALLLVFIAWYSYRKHRSIPPLPKTVLITLRAAALLLVFLLLMNPYFYSSREVEVQPKIAVFLDNSESAGISKGDYRGLESYRTLLNELDFSSLDDARVEFYSIGTSTRPFHPDSITATEPQTNLAEPVSSVLEMDESVQAVVLITDGIITYGRNPAISAYNSSIPMYTIGIGDTAAVQDISVSNILANQTGYTNTNHIIDAEITQSGYGGSTVQVRLTRSGETLQEQSLNFDTDNQVKETRFELPLEEEGLQQFSIEVQVLPDEWSASNNQQSFSVNVLDSKVRILHVAFGIHPDVKTLRRVISTDQNNELSTLTWLGNSFIEELPEGLDEFSLMVIHGTPPSSGAAAITELARQKPTLYLSLDNENITASELSNLELIRHRNRNSSPVRLAEVAEEDEQPIMELPAVNLGDTPNLRSSLRTVLSDPQAQVLHNIQFEGMETESPAIAVLERGNIRRAQVAIWNWYKFAQSQDESLRDYNRQLMSNLVSWTSSDPDDRLLFLSPSKQNFTTSETVNITGSLQNENGEPEPDGIIELILNTPDGSDRTFTMDHTGNGNYQLRMPQLAEGIYSYEATARKGGRDIDQSSGEFVVSNSSSELSNTARNDGLLRSIAQNSGGAFFSFDNIDGFWDRFTSDNVLEPQTEQIENYAYPVRSIFWFLIVLSLLAGEWLLRKYYSLP
ncbi:hypothetical protein [Gracilimonas mengyeensis]|uniref:von Willebrand factor type A domain-containing protein n=1 Tax=Gracilimonas mengyeensis TaxID=1302730 RepID=A0A521AKB5_9BACT|nr:hypothetical protein [Gracilimonas mengyeensis]SMO35100.1 hypothetical protein SAMN06265219_101198 [Gracilimonas mengyeensis]